MRIKLNMLVSSSRGIGDPSALYLICRVMMLFLSFMLLMVDGNSTLLSLIAFTCLILEGRSRVYLFGSPWQKTSFLILEP
jgi:hypothetical protein